MEQIPFASLAKLSCTVGDAEDVAKCGELEYYDKVRLAGMWIACGRGQHIVPPSPDMSATLRLMIGSQLRVRHLSRRLGEPSATSPRQRTLSSGMGVGMDSSFAET